MEIITYFCETEKGSGVNGIKLSTIHCQHKNFYFTAEDTENFKIN